MCISDTGQAQSLLSVLFLRRSNPTAMTCDPEKTYEGGKHKHVVRSKDK